MWVTYSQTLYFLFKVRRAWVIKYNRRHLWEQLKLGSSPITTPLQLFFITHARRTLKRKYRVCEQASLQANMWVEFVVGSFPFSERFFSGCSGFPLSPKNQHSKFQFDQESDRRRTTVWMCYLQIIIYLFTLFIEIVLLAGLFFFQFQQPLISVLGWSVYFFCK